MGQCMAELVWSGRLPESPEVSETTGRVEGGPGGWLQLVCCAYLLSCVLVMPGFKAKPFLNRFEP